MSKSFFEVFPDLELDAHTREIMEVTDVYKVSATKKQDIIRIYIKSNRLIEKSDIVKAENSIRKQLFPGKDIKVKIYEKFSLSAQYTPENLLNIYRESIEMELKDYDHMEYSLFKNASFSYPEPDSVVMQLEDSVVGQKKAPDLIRVLSKIFNERCGLSVVLSPEFVAKEKDTKEPDYSAESSAASRRLEEVKEKASEALEEEQDKAQQKKEESSGGSFADKKLRSAGNKFDKSQGKGKFAGSYKKSDNPDVVFGRDFDDEPMKLSDLVGELGEVTIHGQVTEFDKRDIRNEKTILIFAVTDFTDSIAVKMFVNTEDVPDICKDICLDAFLKIKGIAAVDRFDHELSIQSVTGVKKIPDFTTRRVDRADVKRVELHCHTKMSDMDGVSEVSDIVKQAYKWGMPGIAITDHGVVQALTEANHTWEKLFSGENKKRKENGEPPIDRQDFFKVILGVEAYVVDDIKEIVVNNKGQSLDDTTFVVFDIETTGFSPIKNKIIEIGAVKIRNGEIIDRFSEFINPLVPIPYRIEKLTSITDEMVIDAPTREVIIPKFVEFCEGAVLVGHNVSFDISFINQNCKELDIDVDFTTVDTLWLSRYFFPLQQNHKLDTVAKKLGVVLEHHHRAVDDAECTALIFNKFVPMLKEQGANNLTDVNVLGKPTADMIKHLRPNHCVILAKNTLGRVNLYTLISKSHLDYFRMKPLIPKSELIKYREGLIVGSACCAGELYGAVLEARPPEEIANIVSFYDYLEIQPVANNHFMVGSDKERYESINSDDDIRDINREIIKLGEEFNKPVVATCDAHFLNPEDEIYRTIIMAGKNMGDEEPSPLYLRTTDEMMAEFDYLGVEKAKEIVVDNTRKILDMCESISPVRPDKCPPVIENSDEILTRICYDKAHEIYGEKLPEIVQERLERELNSIISNGFAVMYIIAQKLVWKSNEDGYLVGSRGSVGSSFVAFTSGITEVNSLSPHYVCPNCKYSDFDSEDVKAYGGNSGCDMPDKDCPKCGTKMNKDGFDIPFETFLGFKGDKEPDIDLNFSGEYQSKAHKYTEVIFGYGQTFRAGTIASLADKTAYGFVKKYYDGIGASKRKSEINRIVKGCTGIRRGTGQHPGGIIVLPVGEDINSFCPVQHPANDMTTATITTHYDYHSIDHNLLKLDILGHDDPTMIRFLQDCTGMDPKTVPLDDKKVMSLFMNTTALGIEPEQIGGTKLGCLGLPEFGTDFAMQMVIDAQPKSLSHLIRISGLSHGTDVWLGNAQTLIQEGKATIDTCICCRDDIMIYLIQKGLDKSESFKIMESVRKGKVAKGAEGNWEAWKKDMIDHGVPDWYIWSCEKIKYMFPKAHAAAYVMMAWRIAWFKVYMPQAFYAAWFSIRAKAFNYEHMCQGENHLRSIMREYQNKKDELSNAQTNELGDMRLVEEMYERGIEFMPIDLFKVKSREFQVIGDKIMPSLTSIDGMGEKAADQIVEAAKDGPFLSKDDFRQRTKCPQTVIDKMSEMGLLGDIPDSNQISIFDLMKA